MSKKIDFSKPVDISRLKHDSQKSSNKLSEVKNLQIILKDDKLLYSIKEIARMTGMSYHFIAAKIREGKIPAVSFGDRKMVTQPVVSQLINEGI